MMKLIKLFGILTMLVFVGVGFSACHSDDDENIDGNTTESNLLIGTWYSLTDSYKGVDIYLFYKFESNGIFYSTSWTTDMANKPFEDSSPNGKWSAENNVLSLFWNDSAKATTYNYTISDDGGTLTLNNKYVFTKSLNGV